MVSRSIRALFFAWQTAALTIGSLLLSGDAAAKTPKVERQGAIEIRTFQPVLDGKWIGQGIAYGPYRVGQAPGGSGPTREELVEDLAILGQHRQILQM